MILVLLLGLTVLFGALSSTALAATAEAEGAQDQLPLDDFEIAVPDVVVVMIGAELTENELDTLIINLEKAHGVAWAASDLTSPVRPNVLIGFDPDVSESALRAVENVVEAHPKGGGLALAGRAVYDQALSNRIGTTLLIVVMLASAAVAILVGWLARAQHGLLVGASLVVAGWLSATLGGRAAGPFDGSIVSTAIPAVLAAIVISVFVSMRLLGWFADPVGEDLADMIRRSVTALAVELGLLFAGLVVAAVFLEMVGSTRSVVTVGLVGAITGTFLTLAIVAPGLAGLHGAGITAESHRGDGLNPLVPLQSMVQGWPNGRQFPILVLLAFGFFFGFLSLLALATTTVPALMGQDPVDADDTIAVAVQERLIDSGGDPTAAVLAVFPPGTDQLAKTPWFQRVSGIAAVGRVDTSVGRYLKGELVTLEGNPVGPLAEALDGDEAPRFALVVPIVGGRSAAGQGLVDAIVVNDASAKAELSGLPVDANRAADRDRSVVWLTMITLAVLAGVGVFILVGDLALAAMTTSLRLLDSMALVGLYHLVAGDVSGSELLVLVMTISLGLGLFELAFLRRLLLSNNGDGGETTVEQALSREGWAAVVGLGIVGIASVGLIGGGEGPLTRLGIVSFVAIAVEIVVGIWLLRPAIMGTRAITHLASQPVDRALRTLSGAGNLDELEHQRWAGIVAELLAAEFQFQADPGLANMETVFQADTPLFRKAVEHHQNLAGAGLRIIGRAPQLRTVQIVASSPQATVAVTVDHPVRQLVDQAGKIVGVRRAERRSVMLWLAPHDNGTHRIADSVELGAMPLGDADTVAPSFASVSRAIVE
ncbi:MAG: hypothetical protein GY724_23870 [Actinomycetia bacterium]|nr:hypothetical protein [Actinomycetes bacterium]MCP5035274.1 hypothetical protein [Actinomycetes bacterium]